jgi:MFS family permease
MSTIGGVFNITVCPTVSFKSDRYRGKRWGRRIFFIISTLPMMCMSFLLFAFSSSIGNGVAALIGRWHEVSPAAVTLGVITVIMAMYQFFYMFIGSVIYYIYNDVIPQQFLARVVGMVQVATVAAGALFNFLFFRFCREYFTTVFALLSMCTIRRDKK